MGGHRLQVSRERSSPLRGLLSGAGHGAFIWTAYGLAEYAFTTLDPLIQRSNLTLAPWHWRLSGLLLLSYLLMGALAGALAAGIVELASRRTADAGTRNRRRQIAASMTLALAFTLNLLWFSERGFRNPYLLFCAVALAILAVSFRNTGRATLGALASPWTVALLLLAPCWLGQGPLADTAAAPKFTILLLLLVALGGAAVLSARVLAGRSPVLGLAMAAAAVFGGAAALSEGAPRTEGLPKAPASNKPNVILVVMDTVRADHLSVYGYGRDTSPNLRKFAREATLFRRAIASSDMTLGMHASMFTGLYASWHGAHYEPPEEPYGTPLSDQFQTLAETLAGKGYRTLAVVSNYAYLAPQHGLAQGFHIYDARKPLQVAAGETYLRHSLQRLTEGTAARADFDLQYRRAGEVNADVFRLLGGIRKEGGPFFLFVNYMDCHQPYLPPPPYDRLFPGKQRDYPVAYTRQLRQDILRGKRRVAPAERQHLHSQYDGAIAYLDAEIGRLLARLREIGLYDNSLVIVTADHGEAFGEHDLMEHGVSVYQNQVHVPLIMKFPGQRQAERVDAPASHVDLMPTVLDVAGLPLPVSQGRSLLGPDRSQPRDVYAESFPNQGLFGPIERLDRVERAVFSGTKKFIHSSSGRRELYDLARDPRETENLASAGGEGELEGLQKKLEAWAKAAPPRRRRGKRLDRDALERLKSLGYAQ